MTSVDTSIQTDPFALARDLSGKHFYAGEMRPSLSGKTFPVINPATGETIAEAAFGEAADIDAAVRAGMTYREKLTRETSVAVSDAKMRGAELRGKAMHADRKNIPLVSDETFLELLDDVDKGKRAPSPTSPQAGVRPATQGIPPTRGGNRRSRKRR